jgi:CRP-like cAMP-binding protein
MKILANGMRKNSENSQPLSCECCCIRHLVLFAELNPEDFRLIHRPISSQEIDPGETLYDENSPPEAVFTIRQGLVKLVKYLPDGSQRIVRLLRQGDLAGLETLNRQSYEHQAIALEPVSVCRIPTVVVEKLAREAPRMLPQLMAQWQRSIQQADIWLSELSTGPSRSRIARLLIRLAESTPDKVFYLPSREDIGAMLAITTETASRIIAEFRRKGFIQSLGVDLIRIEIAALQLIAYG